MAISEDEKRRMLKELAKETDDVLFRLGLEKFNNEEYKQAAEIFDDMIKDDPKNPIAWLWKGRALYEAEEFKEATACFNHFLKLNERSPQGWYYYGATLQKLGHFGEARKSLQRAEKIAEKTKHRSIMQLAQDLLSRIPPEGRK